MSIPGSDEDRERVRHVVVGADTLTVHLTDGRIITVPLSWFPWFPWFPRLLRASASQRDNWQVSSAGRGIHWPEVDGDLSVAGLLAGRPAADAVPPRRSGSGP